MSHKLRGYVLLAILLFTGHFLSAEVHDLKPTVILISIDGFRYDYFGKAPTPNLDSLIARGVRARYMVPAFPTKTFPNHYTIVTGLYPAHHGIIANNMWDDDLHAAFKMSDREQVRDARWWGGEPIWVTAQKAGQKTAPMYWPGSEAPIQGLMPTYGEAFDDKHKTAFEYRVNKILSWLDLPAPERPTFLTLYFESVDQAGHDFGPDSLQVVQAVERVDSMVGLLLQGLKARGIENRVNIVVVSDHGMAACSRQRLIMLDDYLDLSQVQIVDTSPVLAAKAKDGNNAALVSTLKLVPHLTVYTPDTVPSRLHFKGSPRITPVIAVADVGWKITSHDEVARHPDRKYGGDHGYDNAAPEMRAIFIAAGPAFKPHRILPGFPDVDVYPLLAHLLNVTPAANDGDIRVFRAVLNKNERNGAAIPATYPPQDRSPVNLPSSKVLLSPVPGNPQAGVGSFPVSAALRPDGRHLAILDGGFGAWSNRLHQGIAVLDLATNQTAFYPDPRLKYSGYKAADDHTEFRLHQTYFLGLAFSADGTRLYASMASLSDPLAKKPGSTGNGIAVYRFHAGGVTPERFISIPPQPLSAGQHRALAMKAAPAGTAIPFPAGLAMLPSPTGEQLLVACNLSDSLLQLDAATGKVLRTFDLSSGPLIPSAYPYAVVANRAGTRAWVSLWNASVVAELDLEKGTVLRRIPVREPPSPTQAGSHPTALLLSPDESRLYVALANVDEVAVISTAGVAPPAFLSTRLRGQKYLGAYPNALAQTADGKRLFSANAGSNAVAVFDLGGILQSGSQLTTRNLQLATGFIPTEWYPTALAVRGNDLLIVSGRSQGTGPNSGFIDYPVWSNRTYIPALMHGSIARVNISEAENNLAALTRDVEHSNLMNGRAESLPFAGGRNPIRHVIYVIKENRTYDQLFGDLGVGDGGPSLTMYGESVTPNHHRLARQFGVLDNFYDSGEVSGIGHVWSTAATASDYTERIWPLSYRGRERTYDFEGQNNDEYPLLRNIPDVNEPGSGYLWTNAARNGLTYRHYGEFVSTQWCDGKGEGAPPGEALTPPPPASCAHPAINLGDLLPPNVGDPRGSPSPYPWPVPMIAHNLATKPELRGHFDPFYPDFRVEYPDQLRADEFLNEFAQFVRDRQAGKDTLPNLIVLRLPQDHTAAKKPGLCRPAACVADNDLALGRVVDAVSHSPYWDDTAILVLEDDAQDGADHVDAHRSIALVISKYAPRTPRKNVVKIGKEDRFGSLIQNPFEIFLDHHFYTTVSMIHTLEVLLGLPPMNNNDAHAPIMAPLFSGEGNQPPFTADYANRDNRRIYQANPSTGPAAAASAKMDLSHADAADSSTLNRMLWRDAKGNRPLPAPRHTVFPARPAKDDD